MLIELGSNNVAFGVNGGNTCSTTPQIFDTRHGHTTVYMGQARAMTLLFLMYSMGIVLDGYALSMLELTGAPLEETLVNSSLRRPRRTLRPSSGSARCHIMALREHCAVLKLVVPPGRARNRFSETAIAS